MLQLSTNEFAVSIENVLEPTKGSPDVLHRYERVFDLDAFSEYHSASRHSITVRQGESDVASVLLQAGDGATVVHQHSAVVVDGACVLAVGPYLASLALPSLSLNWSTKADPATCFGVHYAEAHKLLIFHGELEIAALTLAGQVVWAAGGEDIFTEGLELRGELIYTQDFNGRDYWFDVSSGVEKRR